MKGRGEFLSDDILDANFVKCFATVHTLQAILGTTRVEIIDYFVMPTSAFQRIYSVFWIFCTMMSFINEEVFYFSTFYHRNIVLYALCTFCALLQYMCYLFNLVQVRFTNREKNVQLYLMLQKIDRLLKLNNLKSMNDIQHYYSTLIVLCVFVFYSCGYLFRVFSFMNNPAIMLFLCMALLTLHLELLLSGGMIYYLGIRLRFLTEVAKLNIIMKKENKIPGVDHEKWTIKEHYRIIPNENDYREGSMGLASFLMCLRLILRAFKSISELFQFQVFNTATLVFFWTFLVIEAIVIGAETKLFPTVVMVTLVVWIVFHFIQIMALVITVDWFMQQANGLKALCTFALSIYYEGPIFIGAKGIVKLLEYDKPSFTVYGIFNLDKMFPLKMLGLITSYCLIVLQFTFT